MATIPCPRGCDDGVIYIDCTNCGGTGHIDEEVDGHIVSRLCPSCDNGKRGVTCPRCGGRGEIDVDD